jgi:hypothetical protein
MRGRRGDLGFTGRVRLGLWSTLAAGRRHLTGPGRDPVQGTGRSSKPRSRPGEPGGSRRWLRGLRVIPKAGGGERAAVPRRAYRLENAHLPADGGSGLGGGSRAARERGGLGCVPWAANGSSPGGGQGRPLGALQGAGRGAEYPVTEPQRVPQAVARPRSQQHRGARTSADPKGPVFPKFGVAHP